MQNPPTRRTYTVTGDTLHISDPVLGLSIEYSLVYLNAMIAEGEAELEKLKSYRRRIWEANSREQAATPCPPCGGTGRYGNTNFHCEWCGGTGVRASTSSATAVPVPEPVEGVEGSEQRAGAGEVEP